MISWLGKKSQMNSQPLTTSFITSLETVLGTTEMKFILGFTMIMVVTGFLEGSYTNESDDDCMDTL